MRRTHSWVVMLCSGVVLLGCGIGVAVSSAGSAIASDEDISNVYGGVCGGVTCVYVGKACYHEIGECIGSPQDCEGTYITNCAQIARACIGPLLQGANCQDVTGSCYMLLTLYECELVGEECLLIEFLQAECGGTKLWCTD